MLEGAKSIGVRAATIALAGGFLWGIGNVLSSSIHSVARNPSLAKQSFGYAILGFAFTEVIAFSEKSLKFTVSGRTSLRSTITRFLPEVNHLFYARNIRIGTNKYAGGTAFLAFDVIFDAEAAERHSGFSVAYRYLIVLYYQQAKVGKKFDRRFWVFWEKKVTGQNSD
ncbi:Splicing factor 3B subunit 6-like protein [Striga hermonthica]|uniref:ATP synthase subunit 9, mitochondrial n=1 Tax=Striga hermonthica TaxID=68872 RepID=A0A9N7NGL7_STRHE|nr:Splicing factor 3B subunit 6-like protein [Striga hermonthica]